MQLVTVSEYASMTNTPISTIRMMCKEGRLPALKMGRNWRIDADEAERVLMAEMAENMERSKFRRMVEQHRAVADNDYGVRLENQRRAVLARAKAIAESQRGCRPRIVK